MIGFVLSMNGRAWRRAFVLLILLLALSLLTQASGCSESSGGTSSGQQVSLTSKNAKGRFNDTRVYASYKKKDGKTVNVAEAFPVKHKSDRNKVYLRARNLTKKPVTMTVWTTVGSKDSVKWDPKVLPVGQKAYVDFGPVTVRDGTCLDIRVEVKQGGKTRKSRGGADIACIKPSKNSKSS